MSLRVPTPREKHSVITLYQGTLAALVTAGFTDTLEVGAYATGSVQVLVRNPGGSPSIKIQESNQDAPDAWQDLGAAITANTLRPFTNGARYLRCIATGGTGDVTIIVSMALQN